MDAMPTYVPLTAFPLAVFGPPDWIIVGIYFAAMIYTGIIAARKDQDTREYFLAHRSIPTWAVAISIVATSLSAATFVGVPDLAFKGDLSYLTFSISGLLAVLVVSLIFVPPLYRAGTVTIYGYLNQRFGEVAMIAVSVMFLIGRMLASGARLFIAAQPLCLLMFAGKSDNFEPAEWQLVVAILLIGGVGTFYTAFGGIRTVIWIDVIQFFIVAGAATLTLIILYHKIPLSAGQMLHVLAEPVKGAGSHGKLFIADGKLDFSSPYNMWAAIFGATFLYTAALGVDQDLAQRFLVAKSITRGALSLLWAQLVSIVVVTAFLAIGLLLYIFYKRPDVMGDMAPAGGPDRAIYPWFLMKELPTVLSGISIAGFFAIAQGSMDSAINALASSAVADIYQPVRRRLGWADESPGDTATPKIAVAVMGACMSGLGILCIFLFDKQHRTLIDFALGLMTFAFTGMLGVFLTALLTRRGNTISVIAALLAGVVSVVLMQPTVMDAWTQVVFGCTNRLCSTWWMPIGTVVSFAVCVSGASEKSPEIRGFSVNKCAQE